MYVLVLRPYRKDNIYFRTIEEREKISVNYENKYAVTVKPVSKCHVRLAQLIEFAFFELYRY